MIKYVVVQDCQGYEKGAVLDTLPDHLVGSNSVVRVDRPDPKPLKSTQSKEERN